MITRPAAEKHKSATVIAQSSERRNAPANQDQSAIAQAEQIRRARGKETENVVQQERIFALLRDAEGAAGAFEDFAENEVFGGRWRVFETSCLMGFRDRRQAALDGRRRKAGDNAGCNVESDSLRNGGQGRELVSGAPGFEDSESDW